jgi:hypothetical protein
MLRVAALSYRIVCVTPNKCAMTSDDCLFCLRAVPWRNRPWPRGDPKIVWARPRNGARQILCEIPSSLTFVRLLERGRLVGYDLRCGKEADGKCREVRSL